MTFAAIADGVKTALNAAAAANPPTLTPSFAAKRVYDPLTILESLQAGAAPTVIVYPFKEDSFSVTRDDTAEHVVINVGVMLKLDPSVDPTTEAANATIDPILTLCQTIATTWALANRMIGNAALVEDKQGRLATVAFNPDVMRTARVFFVVIAFTFMQSD